MDPHDSSSSASQLENFLLFSDDDDDKDLDLAMSIIHELDLSQFETSPPSTSSRDELSMLQALYRSNVDDRSFNPSSSDILDKIPDALQQLSASNAQAQVKRREKKCTYQNRREEIQILRDEVIALESQVRKLKLTKSHRRQEAERNQREKNESVATLEHENSELKNAIHKQKEQLSNLIECIKASRSMHHPNGDTDAANP